MADFSHHLAMIVSGVVVAIRWRRNHWKIEGYFSRDEGETSARASLNVGARRLAETSAQPAGKVDGLWFSFSVFKDLHFLLAPDARLEIRCEDVVAAYSDEATAVRTEQRSDPVALAALERQVDAGYALDRAGALVPSSRTLQPVMPAMLRHYDDCDRLVKEIVGSNLHVVGGTLLGLLRNGGPIPHDLDFDAAYLSRHQDPALVRAEFLDLMTRLVERGADIRVTRGNRRRHFAKWRSKDGAVQIDLFPAYIDRDDFYCRPTFVRIPGGREMILPLERSAFDCGHVWAPADTERKALEIFGQNWRTPDVFWRKPLLAGARAATNPLQLTDAEIDALDALREARRPRKRETVFARGVAKLRGLVAARTG